MRKLMVLLLVLSYSLSQAAVWQTRVYGSAFQNCFAGFDLKHKTVVQSTSKPFITIRMDNPKNLKAFIACNSKLMTAKKESLCSVARLNVPSNTCWIYSEDFQHNKCQLKPLACQFKHE